MFLLITQIKEKYFMAVIGFQFQVSNRKKDIKLKLIVRMSILEINGR
jgi:hypothetical protein